MNDTDTNPNTNPTPSLPKGIETFADELNAIEQTLKPHYSWPKIRRARFEKKKQQQKTRTK